MSPAATMKNYKMEQTALSLEQLQQTMQTHVPLLSGYSISQQDQLALAYQILSQQPLAQQRPSINQLAMVYIRSAKQDDTIKPQLMKDCEPISENAKWDEFNPKPYKYKYLICKSSLSQYKPAIFLIMIITQKINRVFPRERITREIL